MNDDLNFKDYPGERLMADCGSFKIIMPSNFEMKSIFCNLCGCASIKEDDVSSIEELDCCAHCKDKWYYPNKKKWSEGWRPEVKKHCNHVRTLIVNE